MVNMSTRSQKQVKEKDLLINKHIENSWLLIVKESLCDNSTFSVITLPHPSHGNPSKFCLDVTQKKVYEIVTFSEPHRSWFIGETVKSDGSLQLVTPFNPIFLVLPRLKDQCRNRAVPIEDLLSEKGFDKIVNFINLDQVADVKGSGDIKAYKYNEEKTISWLEKRVKVLVTVLKQKNIHVTSGATSATFISSNIDSIDEEFYLKYAYGIVSEYLDDYFREILEKHFNFTTDIIETIGNKRKTEESETNGITKKLKFESNVDQENKNGILNTSTEVKVEKPLTAKEKARKKAASGSKTISAFFTKK